MKAQSEPVQSAASRAEQVFFEDPAIDRLMGVVMTLATEHFVLLDRVQVLESRLRNSGLPALENFDATPLPEERADAAAFVESLLRPLLGTQQARGATGDFTLSRAARQQENPR